MATQEAQDLPMKQYVTNEIDKPNVDFVEEAYEPTYDALQTKRLLRKIDWHLIPFLSLLYLLSFLEYVSCGMWAFQDRQWTANKIPAVPISGMRNFLVSRTPFT